MTKPDTPLNLSEVIIQRSAVSITISWSQGLSDGGRPVLDYRVKYALSTSDTFIIASDSILTNTYTINGLQAGQIYKVTVESRNFLYYSDASTPIVVLCATKPSVPDTPTTINEYDYVIIDWEAPSENGLPITGY